MENKKVCVIGGGIVGLTTALLAQEKGANVTVLADKFNQDTTSDGAAGIFRPSSSFFIQSPETTKNLVRFSYEYYKALLSVEKSGVKQTSGYIFSKVDPSSVRNHFLEDLLPEYRSATDEELTQYPGGWKWGSYWTTLLIENRFHLPWASQRLIAGGGQIRRAVINNFSQVNSYGNFDLVFNCAGYGAKKLCNDRKMIPVSGQVFKVEAPWCDKFVYGEADTYIIPGYLVTVGGSRHFESYRTECCPHDGAAIWSRAVAMLPKLQSSQIKREWVGVRPYRDGGVRVEAEIINGLKVVHNYGHGGYGVTSAPGTAYHAVQLATTMLSPNKL